MCRALRVAPGDAEALGNVNRDSSLLGAEITYAPAHRLGNWNDANMPTC